MSQRKRTPARRQTVAVKAHTRVVSKRKARNAGSIAVSPPDWLLRLPWLREAGVPITADTATQVSAVYGCCRLIVDSLASAPIRVYEVQGNGKREIRHDDPASYVLNWSASVSQAPDAPTSQAIEEALFWSALTYGNGYAEIQRDRAGRFFALWPIEPDRVTPRRELVRASDGTERLDYFYEIQQATGGVGRLDPANMFHLRGPSLYGWVGDSTVYRAAKAIGIAQAAQVFAASYFANGTVISGVLSSDKIVSQEQADQAKANWKKLHGGVEGAHDIAVMSQGLKYQAVGHDAQQSQLVESRRFQVQEIARFFGVPTTLLADNEAWTNLSELYLGFYRNALLPWAGRFDAEATRKLFPERQPWREVGHDLTELTMGKFSEKVAALKTAVEGGLKTRNEARSMLGDNTAGADGDVFLVGTSVKRLQDVLKPPAPTPALPPKATPDPEDDPEDGEDDPGEGEEEKPTMPMPPRKRAAADVARIAVALDRFARRMEARRKDIERNAPDKAEANLADERQRLTPQIVAEWKAVEGDNAADLSMRAEKAIDAVLAGEPAHLAAERMLA